MFVSSVASLVGALALLPQRAEAVPGDVQLVRQIGATGVDSGVQVSIGVQSAFIAGSTDGTLPGSPNANTGASDAFLVSWTNGGALRWVRQLGSAAIERVESVASVAGRACLVGTTGGTLPGEVSAGGDDLFVACYSDDGTLLWITQWGSPGDDFGAALAQLDGSKLVAAGSTTGSVFDANQGSDDIVLLTLDLSSGAVIEGIQYGSAAQDTPTAIRALADEVVLVGLTGGVLPGAPAGTINAGNVDAFVTRFDPPCVLSSGEVRWTRQLGTPGLDAASDVDADGRGIFVSGRTAGALPGELSSGSDDAFVAHFAEDGTQRWVTQFGSAGSDLGLDVATDAAASLYVSGATTAAIPGSAAPNAGGHDAFVARFAGDGTLAAVTQLATAADDFADGVAVDDLGHPFVAGRSAGTLPGSPDANAGAEDAFFAVIDGALVDTDRDGLPDLWETTGIDADGNGSVDLDLAALGAHPLRKDVFLEIDSMSCALAGTCAAGDPASFGPVDGVVSDVVAAFANAPVTNPDASTGIRFHVNVSEVIPEISVSFSLARGLRDGGPNCFSLWGSPAERAASNCDAIIRAYAMSHHWTLFARLITDRPGAGGYGSFFSNIFTVHPHGWQTLFGPDVIALAGGIRAAQAGLVVHEIGHNFGLEHGGVFDPTNCKPNYLSVMNYPLATLAVDPGRPLDYSRQALPALNEFALDEAAGVGGPAGRLAVWGNAAGAPRAAPANGPLDFDDDAAIEASVSANVNNISAIWPTCLGDGSTLQGREDWSQLDYNFRNGAGAGGPTFDLDEEFTGDDIAAAASTVDADGDGLANANDNCPGVANPDQADPDGDGIGTACETDYEFSGFFAPVDNPPTLNAVNAGRAIPVKFSLNGFQGLDILAPASPYSQPISCASSSPTDPIEETVSAGASNLSYDANTDRYVYVWKTAKAWKGTCRRLALVLDDGSEHVALYTFK
jgi:hypothetical protein